MKKIAFLIGAGATYGDSKIGAEYKRPPLDGRFFVNAKAEHSNATETIAKFFRNHFQYDIYSANHDRLEGILSMLYSDIYHPKFGDEAFTIFRLLIKLYNRRIAETTNIVEPSNKRNLFKLIAHNLGKVSSVSDITFITFNQDIHLERTLNKFSHYNKYSKHPGLFCFPKCYDLDKPDVTHPSSSDIECFDVNNAADAYPKIYKLHGSLNWYSTHNTSDISRHQIFNQKRKIHVTDQATIKTQFKLKGQNRSVDTFPIIVPPVTHKSSVLHNELKPLWTKAEAALRDATDIIIYGYSCPEADVESANMIRRGVTNSSALSRLTVIDPNPKVVHRYLDLLEIGYISYYKSAHYYLTKS